MAMMRLRREDPRVVGTFRLHRRLGAGGMGVVYLGSDRRGQRVALKVIRPDLAEDKEFRSRFAREVSAARRIRGGCTARLVAADLEAERPWFATQYVPGPSLHDKVNESGPLPASQVASIGAALAEGLVAVHEAGVVHRDLKPSNILLSPKGPRIIDFGIAWATGASTLTHVGTAVGSPGFLAPEQVRGALVTPATDVFALGATLAYAATADSPFGQGSSEVMLYRVVHEEPLLESVHAALAPLIHACLVKAPEERPSPLQLSLRLKEIAAREARGLPEHADGPAGAGVTGEGGHSGGTAAGSGALDAAHTGAPEGHGANRPGPSSRSTRAGGARESAASRARVPGDRSRGRRGEGYARQRPEPRRPERGREHDRDHPPANGAPDLPRASTPRTGDRSSTGRSPPDGHPDGRQQPCGARLFGAAYRYGLRPAQPYGSPAERGDGVSPAERRRGVPPAERDRVPPAKRREGRAPARSVPSQSAPAAAAVDRVRDGDRPCGARYRVGAGLSGTDARAGLALGPYGACPANAGDRRGAALGGRLTIGPAGACSSDPAGRTVGRQPGAPAIRCREAKVRMDQGHMTPGGDRSPATARIPRALRRFSAVAEVLSVPAYGRMGRGPGHPRPGHPQASTPVRPGRLPGHGIEGDGRGGADVE
jgi:hypothetical protein